MKRIKVIKLFAGILSLSNTLNSCHNNKIYFDINAQSIKTCNRKVISELYITNENQNIFFHFSKIPDKKGTNSFSLIRLNKDYYVETLNKKVSLTDFRLIPKTQYKISNSTYGDASSSDIEIRTGDNQNVIFSNSLSCK